MSIVSITSVLQGVLIETECNVNSATINPINRYFTVLIETECNVNFHRLQVPIEEKKRVLIETECNVNFFPFA